jgi:phosphatidylglycerol:prolipoprotein diacylglycerol transferase
MLRFIEIGNNSFIPSYNLLIGIGIALAMLFLQYQNEFKQHRENVKLSIHLSILLSLIGGFVGAFLFDAYTQNIHPTFENFNGIGLTFLGGLISGLLIIILLLKYFSISILQTLNQLTLPFCIAHFFGRLGCFLAGCCFGLPTSSIFGIAFPVDSLPYNHYHHLLKIHPTQLYESFFALFIFIVLPMIKAKDKFYSYIISYSIFRFLLEFVRADNRGEIFNQNVFSPSQLISITIAILITVILVRSKQVQTLKP